jgi:hypothetical protein
MSMAGFHGRTDVLPALADRDELLGDAGCNDWRFHGGLLSMDEKKAQPPRSAQALVLNQLMRTGVSSDRMLSTCRAIEAANGLAQDHLPQRVRTSTKKLTNVLISLQDTIFEKNSSARWKVVKAGSRGNASEAT